MANRHTLQDWRPGRRQQAIELAIFLFLIIPSLGTSFAGVVSASVSFTAVATANILQDLALLSLVLYFLWSNGEPWSRIGLRGRDAGREMLIGAVLFVPYFLGLTGLQAVMQAAGLPGPQEPPAFLIPSTAFQYGLAVVFLVVVAVSEETIFRGYLIRRFSAVTCNTPAAVVLAALVFALGHGYQGTGGVAVVGVLGLVFAAIYLWRGSLVAPMVIHFLQDFLGIIVAPLSA